MGAGRKRVSFAKRSIFRSALKHHASQHICCLKPIIVDRAPARACAGWRAGGCAGWCAGWCVAGVVAGVLAGVGALGEGRVCGAERRSDIQGSFTFIDGD